MGRFDNRDALADKHPALLARLAGAMDAFYRWTTCPNAEGQAYTL
jgi:hypothetical protein